MAKGRVRPAGLAAPILLNIADAYILRVRGGEMGEGTETFSFGSGLGLKLRIMLTSILVFGAIAAIVGFIIYATGIGGSGSVFFWLLVSVLMLGVQWWLGPTIIRWATGAKELKEGDAPELFGMVRTLSSKAGLPMPKLYVVKNPTPNAFAFGRTQSDSGIAVHTGLMSMLDKNEVEGVLVAEPVSISTHVLC